MGWNTSDKRSWEEGVVSELSKLHQAITTYVTQACIHVQMYKYPCMHIVLLHIFVRFFLT